MCGLNQSTIDNIVRGVTRNPRIQTLHHIAIGLNMTLAEFLDFEELNEYSFGRIGIQKHPRQKPGMFLYIHSRSETGGA